MARYRKILVAYDGSDSAKNALILAGRLAGRDQSWIKVVAVVPHYAGDLELVGVSNIKEAIEGPGRNLLSEAREIAEKEDVHILTNLEQGEPYERIVHVAEDENCDLIVLGRRGLSSLERELMGSVTSRVIGHTTKNVMVVPEKADLSWDRILLAVDGSPTSEDAVAAALSRAGEYKSSLTAISVVFSNDEFLALAPEALNTLVDKADSYLEELREKAAAEGVTMETLVKEGEPHEAITAHAEAMNAGIIIMGSHGRKGLKKLLMGSVTERTIGYASCPVLVVH